MPEIEAQKHYLSEFPGLPGICALEEAEEITLLFVEDCQDPNHLTKSFLIILS